MVSRHIFRSVELGESLSLGRGMGGGRWVDLGPCETDQPAQGPNSNKFKVIFVAKEVGVGRSGWGEGSLFLSLSHLFLFAALYIFVH